MIELHIFNQNYTPLLSRHQKEFELWLKEILAYPCMFVSQLAVLGRTPGYVLGGHLSWYSVTSISHMMLSKGESSQKWLTLQNPTEREIAEWYRF